MQNYEFKKLDSILDSVLLCPACSEVITQADISSFAFCPYCNNELKTTPELEDYLLKPAVDSWVKTVTSSLDSGSNLASLFLPEDGVFAKKQ
jgi:hypothetical protein